MDKTVIKPTLYLIRGVAGSGKSTYAKTVLIPKLKEETGLDEIPHFEADDFFMRKQPDGTYKYMFNPAMLKLAHASCLNRMKHAFSFAKMNNVVIVSNTFTTEKEMQPYIDFAKENGIELRVIRMNTWYGSVHDVPEEAIERMRLRLMAHPFKGEIVIE